MSPARRLAHAERERRLAEEFEAWRAAEREDDGEITIRFRYNATLDFGPLNVPEDLDAIAR